MTLQRAALWLIVTNVVLAALFGGLWLRKWLWVTTGIAPNAIRFEFGKSRQRQLRIDVGANELIVVAASGKLQIARMNFGRNLADDHVAISIVRIEWLGALDIRAR